MVSKAWKNDERRVAKFFGTERTPLSGINSKHTHSDTLDSTLFIEHKRRKRIGIISQLWDGVVKQAKQECKLPLVTLTEHNRRGFFVVVHSTDLRDFAIDVLGRSSINGEKSKRSCKTS